jgi:catechol 2,3-dioxygenase-like lactoylglutathione lyase family enzyme
MPIQLAMVGLVVADMKRSLDFYRHLGLDIPADADAQRFVMHRMQSGVRSIGRSSSSAIRVATIHGSRRGRMPPSSRIQTATRS